MNNELYHYGVKGMKWGVRKKNYNSSTMDQDRIIKKGTKFQNISKNESRKINNNPVYTSHNKSDNNLYKGQYADQINLYGDKAYKNTLVLTKDVKVASQKQAVNTFIEMYNKDPKGVSESIGKAYAELASFNKISSIRNFKAKRIEKKFANKGEKWMQTKGYDIFNQTMMSSQETKARMKYYDMLGKKGYDAIIDTNDVNNSGAKDPIIFIKPNQSMKNIKSRELTMDEIELASARYNYDVARKKKGIVDTLTTNQYGQAKKELQRVEEKQQIKNTYIRE